MSWEAWGDGDDGFDPEPLLDAGWWDPDKAKAVEEAINALHQEQVYQNGNVSEGIAERFIARLTMLRHEAGVDLPEHFVNEARSVLGDPSGG